MENKNDFKKFFVKGFLFILCAIPGLAIFLFFSVWIIAPIFTSNFENPPLLLTPLFMVAGIVLMLIGTGKLKEFKYSAVFLFIPIALIIFGFLSKWRILGNRTIDIILFVGLILLFINYLITRHYQKKRERDGINKVTPSESNRAQKE